MFTRKDYVATAEILNNFGSEIHQQVFDELILAFSDMFFADNPKFLVDKFEAACLKDLELDLE